MTQKTISERFYDLITEDEDEDFNDEITNATDIPKNFVVNALNGTATKLGDQLASPSLVLPWLMAAMGAPAYLTGMLVPVRRSLALLPQLIVSGQMRRFDVRKWFWAAGDFFFALFLGLMVPAALLLPALSAGIAIVVLLAFASIARGVASVSFKDVVGKTIPSGIRGRLLAARATSGGILAVLAGFAIRTYVGSSSSLTPYVVLVAAASILWFLGTFLVTLIQEAPGETDGGRNPLEEARAGFKLLKQVPGFRRFILARIFLLSVKLATPFYVLYARKYIGGEAGNLGIFVIVTGLANVFSSPFWGRFADRSSRTVMLLGGLLATVTGAFALGVSVLPGAWRNVYVFALILLLIGFAQAGIRLGRKTHLIDGAPSDQRPLYAAISNTVIGSATLLGGGLGLIADAYSIDVLIAVLVGLSILGTLATWWMPEAEHMADQPTLV
jgi:hypothetical protein